MSAAAEPSQGGASQPGGGTAGEQPSPSLVERGPGGEYSGDDPEIQRAVRRTVGIAALKRIRRIVDADNELEAGKQRWARRLTIAFLLAAVLVMAWMLIR